MCCLLLNMCFRSGKLKTDLKLTESEDELPYQKAVPCTAETREDESMCDNENISGLAITVQEQSVDTEHMNIEINENRFTKTLENQIADTSGEEIEENYIDCRNSVTENLDDDARVINDYLVVEYVHPVPEVTLILEQDAISAMIVIEKSIGRALNHEPKSVEFHNEHSHISSQNDQVVSGENNYIAENVTVDEIMDKLKIKKNKIVIYESFEVELLDSNLEMKSSNSREVTNFVEECNDLGNMTIENEIPEKLRLNSDSPIRNNEVLKIFDGNNVDTTFKGDEVVEELPPESFSDKVACDVIGNKVDAIGISSCGDSDSNNNGS